MFICFCFSGVRACHVPHPRVGLPDQQRVRAFLQVHADCQGVGVLRRHGHEEGRGSAEEELPTHCGGNTRTHPGADRQQDPQPEEHQTLCARRVR